MTRINLGRSGEDAACQYLTKLGYQIVERNFRCRMGEIDIIARDDQTLVFVEVKTRASIACGQPFEAVHYFKQRKLIKLAEFYLKRCFQTTCIACRFDVVSILHSGSGPDIRHLKNAFICNWI